MSFSDSFYSNLGGSRPGPSSIGTTKQEIRILPSVRTGPEYSSLYATLPSHFAQLVGGPNNASLVSSRKRLGQTCGSQEMDWEIVKERVVELHGRGKLRHVATVEDALAELAQVERYFTSAISDKA